MNTTTMFYLGIDISNGFRKMNIQTTAEEIYAHAGNILTMPEFDSILSVEIKTLITELELYDEHIRSIENSSGPISKRGSPLLIKALFLAANVARQNDSGCYLFYSISLASMDGCDIMQLKMFGLNPASGGASPGSGVAPQRRLDNIDRKC